MAKKFLSPIDLTALEIQNVIAQNIAGDHTQVNEGTFYYDSTDDRFKVRHGANGTYNGAVDWVELGDYRDIAGNRADSVVTGPTSTQDLYSLQWDNANTRWTLGTAIAGNTVDSLVESPGSGQDGYSIQWDDTNSRWTLGSSGVGAHNLLSTTHDAVNHPVAAGDIIYGNSTPLWDALAIGTDGYFLKVSSGFPVWSSIVWNDINSTPTTLSGYGITDAYTKTELNTSGGGGLVHWDNVTSTPTTLAGYGITDDVVTYDGSSVVGYVPTWNTTNGELADGYSVETSTLTGSSSALARSDVIKEYVDSVASGLEVKEHCRVATTSDIGATYNSTGGTSGRGQFTAAPNTIDGISLALDDRILVKDQNNLDENGIWYVTTVGTGTNGVWERATDFDEDDEVVEGSFVFIGEGTVNADSGWVLTTDDPITIGGTSGSDIEWSQFSGAGQITAGDGLTKSGNTINAVGTANRITVNADSIDIASTYVGQTSITTLGTISTGTWHGTNIGAAYGGTGINTSSSTGVPTISSGTWSVSSVLSTTLGGTGQSTYTNGQLLIGNSSNSLTRSTLTAGSNITIANGDGSITISADGDGLSKYAVSNSAGTSTTVTHNIGTRDVNVMIYDASTYAEVEADVVMTDTNTVTVTFAQSQTAGDYRIVVIG